MRVVFGLFILLAPIAAQAAGDDINVSVVPKAQQGQGVPALVVRAEAAVASLSLDVARPDGKRLKLTSGAVAPGKEHRFPLDLEKVGKARFRGTLTVKLDDGEGGQMPIDVEVELLAPLEVKIAPEDVDLVKHRLKLRAPRPLKKVQVAVMSDSGTPLGTTEASAGGSEATIEWKQSAGTPMRITVQAWDADDFFGEVELYPWRVDIPHEEVNFETGSHEIRPSEAPKLESSLKLIQTAIDKYGQLATIRLFIAGHTDTVGNEGSNQALSERRARSIGQWFQKRIKIPISTSGFGESMLLIKTPDETDQAKNRRAEYIVAVDPPSMKGARWQAL